jgi:two-component system, cell cycle sensor histidine kinase and response regulator CckA
MNPTTRNRRFTPVEAPPRRPELLELIALSVEDYALVGVDQSGRIMEWNAGARKLFGYPPHEITGRPLATLFPATMVVGGGLDTLFQEAGSSGHATAEGWRMRKGGGRFWGHDVLIQLRDDDGEPVGFGLIVQDVTRRREMHQVLQRSEERFRAAQDRSPDAHVMLGCIRREQVGIVDFEILYANRAARRLFRLPEDLGDVALRTGFPAAFGQEFFSRYVSVVEEGTPIEEEICADRGGEPGRFRLTAVRVGDGIALTVVDYSREDEAGKVLESGEARYLEARRMESLGRLASAIAHDFNDMLSAIMVNAHLLIRDFPEDHPRMKYSREIDQIAGHAAALTRQILTYGAKDLPERRPLDLNQVVVPVSAMLRRLLGTDFRLVTVLDPGLPRIEADPVQLQQVLVNLVLNARDAMPEGGRIWVETESVRAEQPLDRGAPGTNGSAAASGAGSTWIRLSVSDTGSGMSPEVRERIFEPFFTTKPGENGRGRGLGLATVDTIVKRSGGRMEVETEAGKGTTIRVVLPALEGSEESDAPSPALVRGKETILLAEDVGALRKSIQATLEELGHPVLAGMSGGQALWLAAHHDEPIDLLIADVRMPGIADGEVAGELRRMHPNARVLLISGANEHEGSKMVGEQVLMRPFSAPHLSRAVREALGRTP